MAGNAELVTVRNTTRGTLVGDRIRIARSLRSRTVGLLATAHLDPGEGLWIERASSIHMWFMRYPIDAVFVAVDGSVTNRWDAAAGLTGISAGASPGTGFAG